MTKIAGKNIPEQADVVVVGGGIIGCSTAYFLSKRGLKPVVLEKNHRVGWEQSGRNWGFVRQLGRDPLELPMMIRSNRIWQGLEKELSQSLGWQQGGIMGMTDDEATISDYEEWQAIGKSHDVPVEVLSGREVTDLIPDMSRDWIAGIYVPNDGNADPDRVAGAIAAGVIENGGTVLTDCAVTGIDVTSGRVSGVVTEKGVIRSERVVCAAGAWTSVMVAWLGIDLPQLRIRGTVARTESVERLCDPASWTPTMGFAQRADGCFTIAGLDITDHDIRAGDVKHARYFLRDYWENRKRVNLRLGGAFFRDLWGRLPGTKSMRDSLHRARIAEPLPNRRRVDDTMRELRALFPALRSVALKKAWAGHIEITPDMLPVIDDKTGPEGFVIVTGLSGHGFGIGPGVGATVAELVNGETPQIDLTPFRLERFAAGEWNPPYNLI